MPRLVRLIALRHARLTHPRQHLALLRETVELVLREDALAVDSDVEDAAATADQLDLGLGMTALQLGLQTGGPGLVVSNAAVLDDDLHGAISSLDRWQRDRL